MLGKHQALQVVLSLSFESHCEEAVMPSSETSSHMTSFDRVDRHFADVSTDLVWCLIQYFDNYVMAFCEGLATLSHWWNPGRLEIVLKIMVKWAWAAGVWIPTNLRYVSCRFVKLQQFPAPLYMYMNYDTITMEFNGKSIYMCLITKEWHVPSALPLLCKGHLLLQDISIQI